MWLRAISTSARPAERWTGVSPPASPRSSCARGFTLIEVLVALTIVAFAFVGLLGLHNRNLAMVARDQDLTRATLLGRQFITEMELIEQFPDVGTTRGEFSNAPGFSWERQVEDTDLPTVRRVVVHIVWDPRMPNACELIYYIRDRREPDTVN
jgi:general secretion pathway protein I